MKINSKQTGHRLLSTAQSIVGIGMVAVWIGIVIIMWVLGLPIMVVLTTMMIGAGAIGAIFYKLVLDPVKFDRICVYLRFLNRNRNGDGRIDLFKMTLVELKKHVPIEDVHPDGMIEYSIPKKMYGVMFAYDPPSVSVSDTVSFHKKIEYLVNSFGEDLEVSFHFFDMIDNTTNVSDSLLEQSNDEAKSPQQRAHLHGMYTEIVDNSIARVKTAYLMSIKLGKFSSVDDAQRASRYVVPGIVKSLRERGVYSRQLTEELDIAAALREFATMEAVSCN